MSAIDWNIVFGPGGLIGGLVATGGALKFMFNRLDKKARERQEENEARFRKIEAELKQCHIREKISALQEREAIQRDGVRISVIEILWQETGRLSGGRANRTLTRAKRLLDTLKTPPAPNPELDALLRELEEAKR